MFNKITKTLMALTMAVSFALPTATSAEAGRGRGIGLGIAAGIIGLGVLSAAANADRGPRHYSRYEDDGPACYHGPRECHYTRGHCYENRWGEEVCRGGRRVCERPLICE